jgi:hypothetical protein
MVTEDEWYDKQWYDSAVLVEDAVVEIKFSLSTHFNYGPEYGAQDPKAVEPLIMPTFPRATELWATTVEAEPHIDQLIRYYADVVRLIKKHGKSFDHKRHYFWLGLFIENPGKSFDVQFGYYDTLSRMEGAIKALSCPPPSGEVYFDRNQCWAIEIDAHDGMLYIRESDPDYQEVYNVGKFPLLALASSSTAALERAKRIVAFLTEALTEDAWTTYKAVTFSNLVFPPET